MPTNRKKRLKTFNICSHVMVQIHPEQFLLGTIKKLRAYSIDSFMILDRITDYAYVRSLPKDFGISSTFNVEHLKDYEGPDFNPTTTTR